MEEIAELGQTNLPLKMDMEEDEEGDSKENGRERGKWTHKMEFILSLLGYSVSMANIWRYPYICYRNGGGAFLIPYWFFMFTCGIPFFFMEAAIGQFASKSAISIWSIAPIFKGAGYAMVIVNLIVCCYSTSVTMSYVVFFFVNSFHTTLPWSSCTNPWNTPACLDYNNQSLLDMFNEYKEFQRTGNQSLPGAAYVLEFNRTLRSPSDEYFHYQVLQISPGFDQLGELVWGLVFSLLPVWIITGLCLIKGVKSVGKVVYFTAMFPYVILAILLVRGVTLPGAWEGIKFYTMPKFQKLLEAGVWCDAAFQVFFSLGPGWGGIIMMGSYNKFHNNCYRDSLLVPILMGLSSFFAGFVIFSTIGFMAHSMGRPIEEVVEKGPGLAFIMYPEVVTKLPLSQLWSALFFFMLFTVGLDTLFVMVETSITSIWDELPPKYRVDRRWILLVVCVCLFLMGLPCVTQGGIYLLQVSDTYSGTFPVIAVCIVEVVAIFWIYGTERFLDDVKFMIGYWPNVFIWSVIWRGFTTTVTLVIFVVSVLYYAPLVKYGDYYYPSWTSGFGWIFCLVSILWIPGWAIGRFICARGTGIIEKLRDCFHPSEEWGPEEHHDRVQWLRYAARKPYGQSLLSRLRHKEGFNSIENQDDSNRII